MRAIGIIVIIIGVISGLLNLRSCVRNEGYRKASTVVKARIIDVDVEPVKSTVSAITYTLVYQKKDGLDTLKQRVSELHSDKNPLPSREELKRTPKYVVYVPDKNKKATSFPDRVQINNSGKYENLYRYNGLIRMITYMLLGWMVMRFGRKKAGRRLKDDG